MEAKEVLKRWIKDEEVFKGWMEDEETGKE